MSLMIGDEAPDFTANTTMGEINFHQWLGNDWGIFMSHPADFTPVCTTEIGRVANLEGEFKRRNAKVLVLSVGTKPGMTPLDSHKEWVKDVNYLHIHSIIIIIYHLIQTNKCLIY